MGHESGGAEGMMGTHPVQTQENGRKGQGRISKNVTARAYEVYCHVYGKQEAMVTGGCRGGFSSGELIAFLYARSFPMEEWNDRVNEAFREMEGL
ncbi:MAG: hypothetical protein GY799_13395 [Desulfobulbaceae bacterium]|nr:hypothetical protein [Desulfobulbaceae bacterium]